MMTIMMMMVTVTMMMIMSRMMMMMHACMPCDLFQRTPLSKGTEARCHALASFGYPGMMMTPEARRLGVFGWVVGLAGRGWVVSVVV